MQPRYKDKYSSEVAPALTKEFNYSTAMAIPKITKIVVNMGIGQATQNSKLIDGAADDLATITGQKPKIRKARKSIAQFKLREGMPIGVAVTLRRERMWEFYDRFVNTALPRVRDFRGVPKKGFDGRGNFTMGLRDQLIFPEIDYSKIENMQGLSVTICTSAKSDEEAMHLLKLMDFPFRK